MKTRPCRAVGQIALQTLLLIGLTAASSVLAVTSPSRTEKEYQFLFKRYIQQHNKHYHVDEADLRFAHFKDNVEFVAAHNAKHNTSYKLAVNQFADMSNDEFRAKYLGYQFDDEQRSVANATAMTAAPANWSASIPVSVDWGAKGAVSPVKNQGQCGSCWAFATVGSTEGAWFLRKGALFSLSTQQLVDCSQAQGNQGCVTGRTDQAFKYIIANGGICTEQAYPYTARTGTCQTACPKVATLRSFVTVTPGSESDLQTAIALQPVSVSVDAHQRLFQVLYVCTDLEESELIAL